MAHKSGNSQLRPIPAGRIHSCSTPVNSAHKEAVTLSGRLPRSGEARAGITQASKSKTHAAVLQPAACELIQWLYFGDLRLMVLTNPKNRPRAGVVNINPANVYSHAREKVVAKFTVPGIKPGNEIIAHASGPNVSLLVRRDVVRAVPGNRMRPLLQLARRGVQHGDLVAECLADPQPVARIHVHSTRP